MTAGCQKTSDYSNNSIQDLKKYIDFPSDVSAARWEVVTLPEIHGSSLPGPTDFVVLVAVLYLDQKKRDAYLGAMGEVGQSYPIQPHFTRAWMSREVATVLNDMPSGPSKGGRDASKVVRRSVFERAYAAPFQEGVVLYVQYDSPD